MRHLQFWAIIAVSVTLSSCTGVRDAEPDKEGIGYPSVAAALRALKSRKDVKIWTQDGWIIVEDQSHGLMTVWSFTPPDHPAHPAAVKRRLLERDGAIQLEMRALCQASKEECDKLIAEFDELNDRYRESIRKESESARSKWSPSEQQRLEAENMLFKYIDATDNGRHREAYEMHASGMKALMPFERFVSFEQDFQSVSGGDPVRSDIRATWYNDPPHAAEPGVYAAFDMKCRFQNLEICAETVILHEQDDGEFLVMRHERNYVEKDAEKGH